MPFKIDGDEYTYDVGPPDKPGGALDANPAPNSDIEKEPTPVDTSNWDISKQTKLTLAQYLSNVTTGKDGPSPHSNEYPIDYETELPAMTSLKTETGYPTTLGNNDNHSKFAPDRNAKGLNVNSDAFPMLKTLGFEHSGKPSDLNGNSLLPNWPEGKLDFTKPGRPAYISKVLSVNRFTPADKLEHGRSTSDTKLTYFASTADQDGNLNVQTEGVSTKNGRPITIGQLATIGTTLGLRSSLEAQSTTEGYNPRSATAEALALLPSTNQLLISRVAPDILTARSVLEGLTSEGVVDGDMISTSPGGSWGNLNDVYKPWVGLSDVGMVALSAGLTSALLLILEGFYAVLGGMMDKGNGGNLAPSKDEIGRYTLGKYLNSPGRDTATKKLFNLEMLGILPTRHPIARCTQVGAGAFFGLGDLSQLTGKAVGTAFQNLASSPGFNVIIARAIIRSGQVLSERIQNLVKGNPISIAKGLVELVDVLKSSKIIGAMNVFSRLGDDILTTLEDTETSPFTFEQVLVFDRDKNVDAYDSPFSAVAKGRLNGTLKIPWSSNRSPTMYLIPENIQAEILNGTVPRLPGVSLYGPGIVSNSSKALIKTITNDYQKNFGSRLSTDDVASFEQRFDAEYVPFYFHDLRTNEIVSFHAFLDNLTDEFTSEWDTHEGYGRVEPIKTYKSTVRRIQTGFRIVSTSVEDFDEMWVKINKLVTLLYPQFTRGKVLKSDEKGTYTFTQPFSQLMGASPLIRLRIGDVIRSNFSKFALMRMFGYGDNDLKLGGDSIDYAEAIDTDSIKKKLANAAEESTSDYTFYVSPGTYSLYAPPPRVATKEIVPSSGNANVFNVGSLALSTSFVVSIVEKQNGIALCKVALNDDPKEVSVHDFNAHAAGNAPRSEKYLDGTYRIPINALRATEKTFKLILNDEPSTGPTRIRSVDDIPLGNDPTNQMTDISDFFDEKNNAVVKSFKQMGGKGLAGMIESMSFDWLEGNNWEIDTDRKAPMMCKVSLGFSPIHDIAPGLDHAGYNRAPLYPVGRYMKTR